MPVLSILNVLPVVTSVAAAVFLAAGAPIDRAPDMTPAAVARGEVQRCVADGRDADACLDEADGRALVERAEWLARNDASGRRASR